MDGKMMVQLIAHMHLSNCVIAGRTCWDSFHKGGDYSISTDNVTKEDKAFLNRIINKHKHGSISEHLVYTFKISGISRALLQEFSRHRIASLSVKSSRYTLKELKDEKPFDEFKQTDHIRAGKYLVWTGNSIVDNMSIRALEGLRMAIAQGISNDIAKYCLPESYKTELTWTINARSLQNFLSLRTNKVALWEIRDLANAIYKELPTEHQYLFTHCLYTEGE